MGHVVSADGIQTDPDKISSVRDFEVPTIINGFSNIATPLHTLTKQFTAHPRKFIGNKWNSDCQQSFDTLKDQLTTAPVHSYANYDEPFVLETDASMQGLGAVLSQYSGGAYASRSLYDLMNVI